MQKIRIQVGHIMISYSLFIQILLFGVVKTKMTLEGIMLLSKFVLLKAAVGAADYFDIQVTIFLYTSVTIK